MLDKGLPWPVFVGILCLGLLAVRAIHRSTQGAVQRSGSTGCVFILLMLGVLGILLAVTGILGVVLLALPAAAGGFAPMPLDSPGKIGAVGLGVLAVAVVVVMCSE